MKQPIKTILALIVFFLIIKSNYAQVETAPVYSPDGPVYTLASKGDTLVVGGSFKHVGKYTGGGAMFTASSDQPNLSFPKLIGSIYASTPDGNGGYYIYGKYYRESEKAVSLNTRIEHILADNSFEAGFSIAIANGDRRGKLLFYNNVLYYGNEFVSTVGGQAAGCLSAIDVNTRQLLPWIPRIYGRTGTGSFAGAIDGIYAKNNTLYIIGTIDSVGGVYRKNAAAIQIGTGSLLPWNPTPNWQVFYSYSDLVFYNDKIILGGNFGDLDQTNRHACALVDDQSGETYEYIFSSNLPTSPTDLSYLHFQAEVTALEIKGNILYTFSVKNSSGDTRTTAIDLAQGLSHNSTIWTRHFNASISTGFASCNGSMKIINNSLIVVGSRFNRIYNQTYLTQSDTVQRFITGGAKLNADNGALEDWFPDPVGAITNDINTISISGSNVFIGGQFSHANGVDRIGIYMMNSQTESVLPFNMNDSLNSATVYSIKISGDTAFIGGSFLNTRNRNLSIVGYALNSGNMINWQTPYLGTVKALEVNSSSVFAGGQLSEPSGGSNRTNLFSINRQTGTLNSWAPNPNNSVYTLHLNNNQLYVGGGFSIISGLAKGRLASYNISDLSLSSWAASSNSNVLSIYGKSNTIWIGGSFFQANSVNRRLFAGVDNVNGVLRNSPTLNYGTQINSIQSKGCYLIMGGSFRMNGTDSCNGLMMFDLFNKTIVTNSGFCENIDDLTGEVKSATFTGNDLFYGGDFIKVNGKAVATYIGRIRYPANYFEGCGDYISVQNSNWNNPATWERNEVPPASAKVTVRHNVQVTASAICNTLVVEKPSGMVTVNAGLNLTILSNY